jgi:hypothetical protein
VLLWSMGSFGACTLLNPLDYLQENAGRIDASTNEPRDATSEATGPGCPPERWPSCGVSILASLPSSDRPTAIATVRDSVLFATESGGIYEIVCTETACGAPSARVTGEATPLRLGAVPGPFSRWAVWTTKTEVRFLDFAEDASSTLTTLDTVTNPRTLSVDYPVAVWSDDRGVRGIFLNGRDVAPVASDVSSAVYFRKYETFFALDTELVNCAWDLNGSNACATRTSIANVRGATALAEATGFALASSGGSRGGLVASIPSGDGFELELVEQADEGGVVPIAARDVGQLQALSGFGRDIWYTKTSGELCRRTRDVSRVDTVLRGLGARTAIAAADHRVFVADYDGAQVLRVVP